MKAYMFIHDDSDDLADVNAAAADGWRVVTAWSDGARGTKFLLEKVER